MYEVSNRNTDAFLFLATAFLNFQKKTQFEIFVTDNSLNM